MNVNINPFYCNFINNPLKIDNIPKYKVDKQIFVCENADRWTTEDTDCFYYNITTGAEKVFLSMGNKESTS